MALLTPALAALLLAQAPAPTIESTLPCFSASTGAQLTGSGWTPSGQVRLTGTYVPSGEPALDHTVTADVNGRLEFSSGLPNRDIRRLRVEVRADDTAHPELTASVQFTLSWFGPFFRPWNTDGPAPGRPGKTSVIEASGYIGEGKKVLYAHYVRGDEDHFETTRVGRLTGPCGALRRRFRQFDFKPVRPGTYAVYFDTLPFVTPDTYDAPGYRRVVVR